MRNVGWKHFPNIANLNKKLWKKKLFDPFLWMGFPPSQDYSATIEERVYFSPLSPRCWDSFDQPLDDERPRRTWSQPVVLNPRPLDWESSALNTWPLLHNGIF